MMNITEQIEKHRMGFPDNYIPTPNNHLRNERDFKHFSWCVNKFNENGIKKALDVGCFDGWLDFLLIQSGFQVQGVEIVPELVSAATRYSKMFYINYTIHSGEFLSTSIDDSFDAVICFETLEHVTLEDAKEYTDKMEKLSTNMILISLPDQKHEDNPQHLWTPSEGLIKEMYGDKPDFLLERVDYSSKVPSNWFISYRSVPLL